MAKPVTLRAKRKRSGSVRSSHQGLYQAAAAAIEPLEQRVLFSTVPALAGAPIINGDNPNGLYTAAGQPANGVQRSMVEDVVYTFNTPVTISNANDAFTLAVLNSSGGTLPTTLYATAVPGTSSTQWAVSLSGEADGTLASIANGEYSITINPSYVVSAADGTTTMSSGQTDTFYRLFGDINSDKVVNSTDNFQFRRALTTYNPAFDSNGDGVVNSTDSAQFTASESTSFVGYSPTLVGGQALVTEPTSATSTPVSTSSINIAWQDSGTGANEFEIDRSTDGTTFTYLTDVAGTGSGTYSFTDTGLSAGSEYWYRIDAIGPGGPSASVTTNATVPSLTQVTWINSAGGYWDDSANWSTGTVPGSGDVAVISGLDSGDEVICDTATSSVGAIQTSSPLEIDSGGTLTIADFVQAVGTTVTLDLNGTLSFTGNAAMTATEGGQLNITGGELSTDGRLDVNGLNFSGGTIDGGGTGSMSLSGTNSWSGGSVAVPAIVNSGSILDVTGGVGLDGNGGGGVILDNSGAVNLTGSFGLIDSAVISNEAGAVFDISSGGGVGNDDESTAAFDNYGLLEYTGDSDVYIDVTLNNEASGTVAADSGTLQIDAGGSNTNTGTSFTANSGTLEFSRGTFIFEGNSSMASTGSDEIQLQGADLTIDGALVVSGLAFDSGTIDGTGAIAVSGVGTWGSGTDGATLNVDNGVTLDITGGVDLGDTDSGATLNNDGIVNLSGSIMLSNGASIVNESAGVFDVSGSSVAVNNDDSSDVAFDNEGLLEFTGGSDVYIDVPLNNQSTGSVVVDSGAAYIDAGGSNYNTGTAFTADDSTLQFSRGTFTFEGNSSVAGSDTGLIQVQGAVLTTNGILSASGFDFESGTINGAGSISLSDTGNTWNGGTLSTPLNIAAGGAVNVTGGSSLQLTTAVTDAGTINLVNPNDYSSAPLAMVGSSISGGTINEAANTDLLVPQSETATLDGVNVNGAGGIDVTQTDADLTLTDGLTFNGTMSVGKSSSLNLSNSLTIGGGGTIDTQQTGSLTEGNEQSAYINMASGATATLATGTTLAGGVTFDSPDGTGNFVNYGTIETESDPQFGAPGTDAEPVGLDFPPNWLINNWGYIEIYGLGRIKRPLEDGSTLALVGGAMAISPTEVVFGWNGLPMNSGDTYSISETTDGVHFTTVSTTLPAGNYDVVERLTPNTDYQFEVEEVSPDGATWSYRSGTVETNINDPSSYARAYDGPAEPFGVSNDQFGFYQISDVHTITDGDLVTPNSDIIAAGSPGGAFLQAIDGVETTQGQFATQQAYGQVELPYAYDGVETGGIYANQPLCIPNYFGLNDLVKGNVSAVTPNPCSDCGGDPIIYSTGDTRITDTDLSSNAFADGWSITRNWTAQDTFVPDTTMGNGWINQSQSYLQAVSTSASSPNILLVQSAYNQTIFAYNATSGTYAPASVSNDSLTYDSTNHTYTWLDTTTGVESIYYGFTDSATDGKLMTYQDADGNQTNLSYNGDGLLTTVSESDAAGDIETFRYTYSTVGSSSVVSLVQQYIQRAGDSSATLVQQAAYTYYEGIYSGDDAYGNLGDLKTVTIEDADGNVLGQDYYRYYTPSDLADGAQGFVGGLAYSFSTDSFLKLSAAYSDPFSATNAQVAVYADESYEYDSSRRVIQETVGAEGTSSSLGQGTYLYSYELDPNLSSATEDFNTWAFRTTETLPDGNQNIVYTSINGDVILLIENVSSDSGNPANVGNNWITGNQYDSFGRLLDTISPSAINLSASILSGATTVSGIEAAIESYPDLGLSEGLVYSNQGLIDGRAYYGTTSATETTPGGATGFVEADYVQNGADGTPIEQDSYTYFAHSDFAGMTIYPVAASTLYQSSDDGGSDPETTTYSYTWQSNSSGVTNQVEDETTTNPVVSTSENGSGTASTTQTVYNTFGRPVWTMDGNGYITYTAYDNATGAVIQSVQDVDTSDLSDLANYTGTSFSGGYNAYDVPQLPTGWSIPAGGGLNLVTTDYVDGLGRTIEQISPAGNITLYVYDDVDRATFTLPGVILDSEDETLTTTTPITMTRTAIPYSFTHDGQTLEGLYDETLTFSINTPISYTAGETGEPLLPQMPGFIQGDGATSGPANVLNLIGDGSSSSPQFTIQSLTRDLYNNSGRTEGQLVESDAYAQIDNANYLGTASGSPYSGTSIDPSTGTGNYAPTMYGYDVDGRLYQAIDANGTIGDAVYDSMDRVVSEWVGTDDATSNGTAFTGANAGIGNNMTEVESFVYDNGGAGDCNVTEEIQYADGTSSDNRVTENLYDWRDRLIATKSGVLLGDGSDNLSGETDGVGRPITVYSYDNLNEVVASFSFDGDGIALSDFANSVSVVTSDGVTQASVDPSALTAYSTASYDSMGNVYQSAVYSVDPISGDIGADIVTNKFYDNDGNLIATFTPGQPTMKYAYDGAGRQIASYTTDGGAVNNDGTPLLDWNDADTINNDVVVSETKTTYDGDGNAKLTTTMDRLASADTTTPGALTSSNASISYVANYYDPADRLIAEENVGTNGGSSWTRPSTPDASDATHLVTTYGYDAAGNQATVTDPAGIVTQGYFDALGRTTETIADYTNGIPSNDSNQATEYTYDGDNNVLTMTAVMPSGTPSQTTAYVYGVSPSTGSALFSNDLLQKTEYPDATTGEASASSSNDVSYAYNNLGQQIGMIDQNGTTHTYTYDVLGRLTLDSVQVAAGNPENIDTSVLALGYSYNSQGLPFQQTSYSNANGTGVVNQDEDVYNGFGQISGEYQSVSGAVDTATTPEVQYVYSSAATGSLPTEMIYPNGRILHYGYNDNALDAAIGRVDYLADDNGSGGVGAHLTDYTYRGLSTIISQADGNGVTLTTTLDQFGRVQEMNWVNTATETSTDDFQYGYDQDGNVLYQVNGVNVNFSQLFSYDSLNRLTSYQRGTLSSDHASVTTANTLPGSSQSWSLDPLGNQISATTDGTQTNNTTNSQNELTANGSSTLTYDNDGNTAIDENADRYVYNSWNQLVAIKNSSNATLVSYTYDANGRRVTQTASDATTTFYVSTQGQIIEERQGSTVTAQNVWNIGYVNDLLLRDDNSTLGNLGISGSGLGERLYAQHDATFDVTALIDTSGNVVERLVYASYGQQTILTASWASAADAYNWPYYYQGMRLVPDGEGNLLLSQSRVYDTVLGRWQSPDSEQYINGSNLYQFVQSNPVNFIDPLGHQKWWQGWGSTISSFFGGDGVTGIQKMQNEFNNGLAQGVADAANGFSDAVVNMANSQRTDILTNPFGGLPAPDFSRNIIFPESSTVHRDSKILGGIGLMTALTGGIGGEGDAAELGEELEAICQCFVAGTRVLMADEANTSSAALDLSTRSGLPSSRSHRSRESEREIGIGLIVLGAYGAYVIHRIRKALLLKQAEELGAEMQALEMPLRLNPRRPILLRPELNTVFFSSQPIALT